MLRFFNILLILLFAFPILAQNEEDAFFIKEIYRKALSESNAYAWLYHLSEEIGGRIAGSPEADQAVDYTKKVLDSLGVDQSFTQACDVTYWNRKTEAKVHLVLSDDLQIELSATSLGNTIGTNNKTLTAEVVEVMNFDELKALGREKVEGKIVFFNRPVDPTLINSFSGYGGAVDQRVFGAIKAAEMGAIASVVRSITSSLDDVPHTGSSVYSEGIEKVPSVAISTKAAELLSKTLKNNPAVRLSLSNDNEIIPGRTNYNVIGEWKGTENPDMIIVVGGHLDSWDIGGGAHDDGAGCVQSMGVIEVLKSLDYKPKHTIRCVLFANEENGLAGGRKYAELAKLNSEKHIAALESDSGGFSPRAFSTDGLASFFDEKFQKVSNWFTLLEPYGVTLTKGGSGADISPLKSQGPLLFGLRPDTNRYFDYHHTAEDRIQAVHKRELNMGTAAMAALVYLIDQYGI